MTEAQQRAAVVAEARTWLGTPWHHMADIKGQGVDCAMLLCRVYIDAGVVPAFDPRPYPKNAMLHQDEERFLGWLFAKGGHEVSQPGLGDIVVWRFGRAFAHGGIITEFPRVIHAYGMARQVQEDDLSRPGRATSDRYPRRYFSIWGAA